MASGRWDDMAIPVDFRVLFYPGLRIDRRQRFRPAAVFQRQWHLLALIGIVIVAAGLRLANLDNPTDNFDEGAYLASLFLMREGYRPFADIVTGEGPLNLHLAFLSYAAGGFTLTAARTGTALLSLTGVLGAALAGRALGGPLAGIAAAFILALSPAYLRVSRWVGPEAVAVSLAMLAVAAAAWAYRSDRDRWRLAAGALFGLANLVQASVPAAAVAIMLLTYSRRSSRSILLAPFAAGSVVAVVLMMTGPVEVISRIVSWRLGGHQLDPSIAVIQGNAFMLLDKMYRQEQPAVYALAAIGALVLLRSAPQVGLALLGWVGAQLALLLCYSELSAHLGVTLLAPVLLMAGIGLGAGLSQLSGAQRRRAASVAGAVLIDLVGLWYVASVPAIVTRDQRLINLELSFDREIDRDARAAVSTIANTTTAQEFVVTDQPYLAFLADRKVPPELVDPSTSRIDSGSLDGGQVVANVRERDVALVVLWSGKLVRLPELMELLESEFEPVAAFSTSGHKSPRVIYRRLSPTAPGT